MKPANQNLWAERLNDLYVKLYHKGVPWADNYSRNDELKNYISHDMQSVLRSLSRFTDFYATMTAKRHRYDKEATDAMTRLTEPVLRGYYEVIVALGGNMTTSKLRKSVPSKSRLQKIYSQSCAFNPFAAAPYDYTKHVLDREDPIQYERAYYYMAIRQHGADTLPEHIALAKADVDA